MHNRPRFCKALWVTLPLTLLWMFVIFGHSLQSGSVSGEASESLTQSVNQLLQALVPALQISELFLRKLAHFGEFAVLSALLCTDAALFWRLFSAVSLRPLFRLLLAIPASAVVALGDEGLQRLSEGRHPSLVDVGIDTAGAAFAVLLYLGILSGAVAYRLHKLRRL